MSPSQFAACLAYRPRLSAIGSLLAVLMVLDFLAVTGCQGPSAATAARSVERSSLASVRPPRSILPSAWRQEVSKWLGTPYRVGGLNRSGIDCSGLVVQLYQAVAATSLPRTTAQQYRMGRPVSPDQRQAGDLLFFDLKGQGVGHVGVALEGDHFVHASTSRGVIVSSIREPYYAVRLAGLRRLL